VLDRTIFSSKSDFAESLFSDDRERTHRNIDHKNPPSFHQEEASVMERISVADLDSIPFDESTLEKAVEYHAELKRDDVLRQQLERQGSPRPAEYQGEEQPVRAEIIDIPLEVIAHMRRRVSGDDETPIEETVRIYREKFLDADVVTYVQGRFPEMTRSEIIKNFEQGGLLPSLADDVKTAAPYEKVPGGGKKRPFG
jgi:hypothetical protein